MGFGVRLFVSMLFRFVLFTVLFRSVSFRFVYAFVLVTALFCNTGSGFVFFLFFSTTLRLREEDERRECS